MHLGQFGMEEFFAREAALTKAAREGAAPTVVQRTADMGGILLLAGAAFILFFALR